MAERGTHEYAEDKRNENILIYVNGDIVPRIDAKISVFDSGFLLGDGVWEGIRLHNGQLAFGREHFTRLYEGAKAIDIDVGISAEELESIVMKTVEANSMSSGVHIRLIVSRGLKKTPYQHPSANIGGSTIVIIPEYKTAGERSKREGIRLCKVNIRRFSPDTQDPRINSLSKFNCIAACIEADKAGYDEALMLDPIGFVSTCNSTNFFTVRNGEVWTSTGKYCLNGVTRGNIIRVCRENEIPVFEKDFSLTDVYGSEESFVTGTFAGVIPVVETDGKMIGDGKLGSLTERLQVLYKELVERECPVK